MSTTVRLIATDLDGTLLRSDRTVSQRTRDAVAAAQAAGIVLVVATARHPTTAAMYAAEAGITGLAICANGALIYDLARNVITRRSDLSPETARTVIEQLRALLPDVTFALNQGIDFVCEPAYATIAAVRDHGRDLQIEIRPDVLAELGTPLTKLIVRHPELTPPELYTRIAALELDGFEASLSGAPFVDIVASGVSKAAALAAICADLGIDSPEVVAFGDAPNDLPMLLWAGRPIAVANAYPEVLAAVPEQTASNDDDGVALAIKRLLDSMRK
jgi:Cof subfamily protein (haloacid dehalogenase superfamily)